jgi:hypothetical protein
VLGVENPRPLEVKLAEAFSYPGVASAYRYRPPYPEMVFDVLTGLITDAPSTVLDLGAGEGALARPLAARVDAVDISAALVGHGHQDPPWEHELNQVIARHSRSPGLARRRHGRGRGYRGNSGRRLSRVARRRRRSSSSSSSVDVRGGATMNASPAVPSAQWAAG